ncbi:MAG: TonB-dependent receptor [Opitutaceae bacterium]|nr:TonB-dependent receptor [Opitutaceae bacterium]
MHTRPLLLVAALAFSSARLAAAGVTGSVRAPDSTALAAAEITVAGTNFRTASATDGTFVLNGLPPGPQKITVSYLGYDPKSFDVVVPAEGDARVNAVLGAEFVELDAVTVTGIRTGQARALNEQRSATNLTSIISSDFSGQFPDKTIADAVKRLPGVTVETDRDTGGVEGRYITVRGMTADYNAVTIDGMRVNVTDFDGITRRVPLDVVSADVADQIEVTKALRPDQDADSIGGAINIRTRSAFSRGERSATAKLALSYADQLENYTGDFPYENPGYEAAFTYSDLFGKEKQFGFSIAANTRDRTFAKSRNSTTGWNTLSSFRPGTAGAFTPLAGGPAYLMDSFVLQDFVDSFQNTGLNGSLEWRPTEDVKLRLYGSTNARITERGRQRQNIFFPAPNASGQLSNVVGTPVVTDDTVTDFTHGVAGGASTNRNTVRREVRDFDEDQITSLVALDGEVRTGEVTLTGMMGYNLATWDGHTDTAVQARFDNRNFISGYEITPGSIETPDVTAVTPGGVDRNDPSLAGAYTMNQLNRGSRTYDDDEFNTGLDAKYDTELFGWSGFFKTGAKLRTRSRELDHTEKIYRANSNWNLLGYTGQADIGSVLADYGVNDVNGYDYGYFIDPDKVRDVSDTLIDRGLLTENTYADGTTLNDFFSRVDDYSATEDIYAGYVMGQFTQGKLTVLPGARVELTHTRFETFQILGSTSSGAPLPTAVPIAPERDYVNVLPGLHLRYDFTPKLVARAAYTESLARPTFSQLNPRETRVDSAGGTDTITRGDLDLKPTYSRNYDLALDRYFGNVGYVSIGVFYKDYEDNIYRFTQTEIVDGNSFEVTQPRNAIGGKLKGFELAADYQFTFLPAPLDGLGVSANYTKTDSELDSGIPSLANQNIPLFDQVEDTVNLSVYYDKGRWRARVAFLYRSESLFSYDTTKSFDLARYEAPSKSLDISASYRFARQWTVFGELNNVLDGGTYGYNGDDNLRLDFNEYSGWAATVGLRWSL